MDVENSGTSDGDNPHQWSADDSASQQWEAIENDDDTFRFRNVNSGKVLSVENGSSSTRLH